MILQLSETLVRKGETRTFPVDTAISELTWMGKTYPVTDWEPVSLRLENKGNSKYQLQADIRCVIHMPCDRCLTDVPVPLSIQDERELIVQPSEAEQLEHPQEDSYIRGYELDVDEFIRSELFLNIPMKVLCKADCRGLCPTCGADLNQGSCGCEDKPLDPRMAAIQDIFRNANLER